MSGWLEVISYCSLISHFKLEVISYCSLISDFKLLHSRSYYICNIRIISFTIYKSQTFTTYSFFLLSLLFLSAKSQCIYIYIYIYIYTLGITFVGEFFLHFRLHVTLEEHFTFILLKNDFNNRNTVSKVTNKKIMFLALNEVFKIVCYIIKKILKQ